MVMMRSMLTSRMRANISITFIVRTATTID